MKQPDLKKRRCFIGYLWIKFIPTIIFLKSTYLARLIKSESYAMAAAFIFNFFNLYSWNMFQVGKVLHPPLQYSLISFGRRLNCYSVGIYFVHWGVREVGKVVREGGRWSRLNSSPIINVKRGRKVIERMWNWNDHQHLMFWEKKKMINRAIIIPQIQFLREGGDQLVGWIHCLYHQL